MSRREHPGPDLPDEAALTELFARALGAPRPGVHRLAAGNAGPELDFFALGGTSLDAGQLVARINERYGLSLLTRHLFEAPTPAALSRVLKGLGREGARAAPPAPRRLPREGSFELSPAQGRLWYLDRIEPGDPGFNMSVTVRFDAPLEIPVLRRCLDEIVARHEVLRTRFVVEEGRPRQVIDAPRPPLLETVDLTDRPPEESGRLLLERAGEILRRPFDLSRDLMLRGAVLCPSRDERLVVLILHHIAADGWSIGVLLDELSIFYRTFREDLEAPCPLPAPELQYADLAQWHEDVLSGGRLERLLSYWTGQLEGAPASLELPFDRPRPAEPTGRGEVCHFHLGAGRVAGLRSLGLETGATLFMTLLAVFDVWLFRISGQSDLLVSVPAANRLHSASRRLIGFFSNMVVVRSRLRYGWSFADLLGHVREVSLDAFAHQDLPFDHLVEALQPARRRGQMPFVQVGLALQNAFRPLTDIPGLTMVPLALHSGTSRFDLSVSAMEAEDALRCGLEFSTDLFDRATVERLAASFRVLAASAVEDPSAPVDRLALLTEAERRQLVVEWNRTDKPFPLDRCFHHWIEDQAGRTPDAAALRYEERGLTYREMDRRADGLARRLRESGVEAGWPVGIFLERSLELPVALYATLKADGVCLPLDPDLPSERVGFMLAETGASRVLTAQRLRERLAGIYDGRVMDVAELAGRSAGRVPSRAGPGHLAYILYTSGSTGRPKGVRMHHRGLGNRLLWQQDSYPLTGGDRILQSFSIGFDAAFWQIFAPLLVGAQVVLPRPGGHMDTAYLASFVAEREITSADFVPSVLTHFLDAEPRATALRQIVCGGETLYRPLARRTFEQLPGVRLVNIYGPAETSLTISTATCPPPEAGGLEDDRTAESVGRPIANTKAYLLDRHGSPVPTGVVGEVHAAGAGITQGYLRRPALTAQRYLPSPFAEEPGDRTYRTGDLARYRSDGTLEFQGRADDQVKIRGIRVEPGEIEAQLGRLAGVREAVVLARDDVPGAAPGDKRLVAYVVPGSPAPAPAALREGLSKRLPPAMVPGIYLFLDAFPLSVNGKVRRDALPPPDPGSGADDRAFTAPRDRLEAELARVWSRTLKLDRVSITDNFFELGGHSLLAVQLMSEVQRRFGVGLDLAQLYAAGTVEGMASLLRARDAAEISGPVVVLRSGGGRPPLFCVHSVDGAVDGYGLLARALDPEVPVYALQAPGLEGGGPPPASFEELAALHAAAILRVRRAGPYTLCGWSMGGILASEVARQLEAMGREVARVILLDSFPPGSLPDGPPSDPRLRRATFTRMIAGHGSPPPGVDEAHFLNQLLEDAVARRKLPPGTPVDSLRRRWQVFEALDRASLAYRPERHGCPVLLIRTELSAESAVRQVPSCRVLTRGELRVAVVPGNHQGLLRTPAVGTAARWIEEAMAGRESRPPDRSSGSPRPETKL